MSLNNYKFELLHSIYFLTSDEILQSISFYFSNIEFFIKKDCKYGCY
jgi:hypothetical protein